MLVDGGENVSTRDCTVVVAEDDDDLRETMKIWAPDDWGVREASDGKEALERLDDAVDALVLDRHMKSLTGSDVVERLHETSFEGEIIVVSAYKPDDHLNEDDVTDYLVKPLERDDFLARLHDCIE